MPQLLKHKYCIYKVPDYSATDTSVISYAIIPENPPFSLLKNRDMENQV